jgi:hypothetical protein
MNIGKIDGFSWLPDTPWRNQTTPLASLLNPHRKKIERLARLFPKVIHHCCRIMQKSGNKMLKKVR